MERKMKHSQEVQVSVAVAFVNNVAELNNLMDYLEKAHQITLDRKKIKSIWHDIRHVKKHYLVT